MPRSEQETGRAVSSRVAALRSGGERGGARRGRTVPPIGEAIRRLRKQKGMSIQDLADASGVSVGMLSQIERDRANPSLRILTSIREALAVPVSALFDEPPAAARDPEFVRRAADHARLDLGSIRKELLSPRDSRALQFMVLDLSPHATSGGQPISYASQKGGLVLQGALELRVGGEEAVLQPGDSFLFDGTLPHSLRNPIDAPSQVLWIIVTAPPERHL